MDLLNFEMFLEAISKDELQKSIEDAVGSKIVYTDDLLKDGNFGAFLAEMVYQSVEISGKISLIYLKAYHQWLQQQFEQSSGDPS